MKSNKLKLVVLLLLFAGYFPAKGQVFTESKRIVKSFKLNSTTTVSVTNKYGKIHIVPWDKDSVRFEIDMLISSKDEERIEAIKNEIDFDFLKSGNYIIAKTRIEKKHSSFLMNLKAMAESITSSSNEVGINYKIYIPSRININLNNKFGDIYTSDHNGSLSIKLSNGDLKANNLTGISDIEIKFGDAVINTMKSGRIDLYDAEMYLKSADNLSIDSKSSKITIDKIGQLKLLAKRGKVYLKEVGKLYGTSSFTNFWIYEIKHESSFSFKYGNISFESIDKGFTLLNLTLRNADLNLYFEKPQNYELDITHEKVTISYPVGFGKVEKRRLEDDDKKFLSYGKTGNGTSKVKLNAEDGSILIIHK